MPKKKQSGKADPELHISKAGDENLRCLLVSCAHYILGPFAEDSDLRRLGERIAAQGGKVAKRRAVVAVARNTKETASQALLRSSLLMEDL